MISEEDKLEFESLPEFVREPKPAREHYSSRPSYSQPKASAAAAIASGAVAAAGTAAAVATSAAAAVASKIAAATATKAAPSEPLYTERLSPGAKNAELEALWPGVGHDVFHSVPRKSSSNSFFPGFISGVAVTLAILGISQFASHMVATAPTSKEIIVAQAAKTPGKPGETAVKPGEPAAIIPLAPVYQVGSGDTLAGIALKNYHRATPRLLDEICKANNMANANVLNLGQKLRLPDYHPQSRQIATGVNQTLQ